ncbi:MAG: NAD(+) diphosphatase [Solirubrobacteraceae bacterium]|nr:NAD(+) diphosphatase [Solirubrobacteraceae bacterium]
MSSPEPSSMPFDAARPMALTGAGIDRAADRRRRDADWLATQRDHAGARVVLLGDAGVRAANGGIELVSLADVEAAMALGESDHANELVLLGVDGDGPIFALDEDEPREGHRARLIGAGGMRGEAPPEALDRIGLRVAAQTLTHQEGGLIAYAAAVLNWHRTHRFCSVCSAATLTGEGGMVRTCPTCGTHHHPRTDPVVIMLVTDGADRVLLGRQAVWPARRYSTLAGFVSPGESLEEAVAREVFEEVGVQVGLPSYVSSQPWPFPMSLMLGFHVPWTGGDIAGDDDELEDARWFSRDEVVDATGDDSWEEPRPGEGLLLPPRSAIARRLVEGWLDATA